MSKMQEFFFNPESVAITTNDSKGGNILTINGARYIYDKKEKKYIQSAPGKSKYVFKNIYETSFGYLLSNRVWIKDRNMEYEKLLADMVKTSLFKKSLKIPYDSNEYFTSTNLTDNSTKLINKLVNFENKKSMEIFITGNKDNDIIIFYNLDLDTLLKSTSILTKECNVSRFKLKFNNEKVLTYEELLWLEPRSVLNVDGQLCMKLRNSYNSRIKKSEPYIINIQTGKRVVLNIANSVILLK
jgi:hypothetical protein